MPLTRAEVDHLDAKTTDTETCLRGCPDSPGLRSGPALGKDETLKRFFFRLSYETLKRLSVIGFYVQERSSFWPRAPLAEGQILNENGWEWSVWAAN